MRNRMPEESNPGGADWALYRGAPIAEGVRPQLIASGTSASPFTIVEVALAVCQRNSVRQSWVNAITPGGSPWRAAFYWPANDISSPSLEDLKSAIFIIWRYNPIWEPESPRAVTRGLGPHTHTTLKGRGAE